MTHADEIRIAREGETKHVAALDEHDALIDAGEAHDQIGTRPCHPTCRLCARLDRASAREAKL